ISLEFRFLLANVIVVQNDADREPIRTEWKNPDPPFLFTTHVDDQREAFLQTTAKLSTLIMSPKCRSIELRKLLALGLGAGNKGAAPATIQKEAPLKGPRSIGSSRLQPNDSIRILKLYFFHFMIFQNGRPVLAR